MATVMSTEKKENGVCFIFTCAWQHGLKKIDMIKREK
jgi:hypothetical protein